MNNPTKTIYHTIRFGKHKGKLIEDIPSHYLEWFIEHCEETHPESCEIAEDELKYRTKFSCH